MNSREEKRLARRKKSIKHNRPRVRLGYEPNPVRFYRVGRLADLLGVDVTTIWRWSKDGTLPPSIQLNPSVRGWRETTIKEWLDRLEEEVS